MDTIEKTPVDKAVGKSLWAKSDAECSPEELAVRKRIRRLAYYGVRPGTPGKGTPAVFLDDEKPPVFHFDCMTGTDMQEYRDQFYVNDELPMENYPAACRWVLDRKLTGWNDFTDRKGIMIPFERDDNKVLDPCYDSIPVPLRRDLLKLILDANVSDEKETQGVKS